MTALQASRGTVMAVPEVPWTDTWHPVSHKMVIDGLSVALVETGIGLCNEKYELSANGHDMFGTWTLEHGTLGRKWAIGIRNSTQKHFSLGIAAGFSVMVCSNMMISGDYITFRKHTKGLDHEELRYLMTGAMSQVIGKMEGIETWHNNLRNHNVDKTAFKALTFDAMQKGVVPPSKFNKFIDAYQEEQKIYREDTAHTFHGAVTRLQRDNGLFSQADRCGMLETILDQYCYNERLFREFKKAA